MLLALVLLLLFLPDRLDLIQQRLQVVIGASNHDGHLIFPMHPINVLPRLLIVHIPVVPSIRQLQYIHHIVFGDGLLLFCGLGGHDAGVFVQLHGVAADYLRVEEGGQLQAQFSLAHGGGPHNEDSIILLH